MKVQWGDGGGSQSPGLPRDPVLLRLEAEERCQGHPQPQRWCRGRAGTHLMPLPGIAGVVVPSALRAGDGNAGHPRDREEAPSQELTRHLWDSAVPRLNQLQLPARGATKAPWPHPRSSHGARRGDSHCHPCFLPDSTWGMSCLFPRACAELQPLPAHISHPPSPAASGTSASSAALISLVGGKELSATASSDGCFSAAFSVTLGQGAFPTGEGRASPRERQLAASHCCRAG